MESGRFRDMWRNAYSHARWMARTHCFGELYLRDEKHEYLIRVSPPLGYWDRCAIRLINRDYKTAKQNSRFGGIEIARK